SQQRDCFTSNCHHDDTFDQCIAGAWNCHAGEFCEVTTTDILNNPILNMQCKHTGDDLAECQAQSNNDDTCSPTQLVSECVWCCEDEACVRALAD
ncbi:hypothetical protein BaRGS_00039008, partial [Batillaria attramentaria]